MKKVLKQICVGLILLPAASLWSQVDNTPTAPTTGNIGVQNPPTPPVAAVVGPQGASDRMLTPPPVSGQTFPVLPTALERSNYLRGGLAFTAAYIDNALGSITPQPVSDISYSLAPFVALDETTPRLHLVTTYAPGFTFYQKYSSRNEQDQNASIDLQYRLSPHVTFSARDGFQKSSNVFNQPDLGSAAAVSGAAQASNFSVFAPIADLLRNSGNVDITYQFAQDAMVGASGTFTNLHYPNQAEVPGLFDASSQAGSGFYAYRASKMHYLGVTYQYQRLVSYLPEGNDETQTQAVLFFYTLYASSRLSMSFFGGPQYSNTTLPPLAPTLPQATAAHAWNPAGGGSIAWQARLTSLALSYAHTIAGGGGLAGAVHMDNASLSIRQQMTRNLSGSLAGGYTQNDLLTSFLVAGNNGHTLSGTAALQRQLGQRTNVQLGYTRLHQVYSNVAILATTPNTNREFISISYQFSRPLGR